jgi:phage terminase large subunit-like protein
MLEDQMCTWVPGDEDSPDRVDAAVWALTELMLEKQGSWRPL